MSVTLASWRRMWGELGVPTPDELLFRRLVAAWSEPWRHYHSLQHLRECLELLDASRDLAWRPAEIEMALWFHDAVYEPRRDDNEARSAQWAREAAVAAVLSPGATESICTLVMATKDHAPSTDCDTQLLLDIDLAILGAAPARFAESTTQVREEYAHVPEPQWREGRARVLQSFLDREQIYGTPQFRAAREQRARENLAASLRTLAGPATGAWRRSGGNST
ncbi:HD domain-containing protein [Ramlibacter albus]|uniref:N-methyl-D-aspartate receptor NMDAR2C subunit n=1 Tax=Ramlibacter albus TaxID=2079448 RepID=A0A923M8M9_9BURK|nr:N-methyl-D-aspartate receptor NMDAR2C subunit [Ramlibacter albus]MBC5766317.1 N-methyl-D-aspartate receptor NMDAR2C subunit [Ramlibacter albus]